MQADPAQIIRLLKTARGQLDGILKMIEEDRYCMEISHQLLATSAVLQRANREILRAHMKSCVREAVNTGDEKKLDELVELLDSLSK